jgi:hypothetical protein
VGASGGDGLSPGCCDVKLKVGVSVLVVGAVEIFTSKVEDRASVVDVKTVLVFERSCVVLTIIVLELPPPASTFFHSKPMSCSLKT